MASYSRCSVNRDLQQHRFGRNVENYTESEFEHRHYRVLRVLAKNLLCPVAQINTACTNGNAVEVLDQNIALYVTEPILSCVLSYGTYGGDYTNIRYTTTLLQFNS